MEQNVQCVIVKVQNEQFGINIRQVRCIEPLQNITPIPQVPLYVKGITNLRGSMIPVIDLRERLSLGTASYTKRARLVVVIIRGMEVGLIVEAANEIVNIDYNQIDTGPDIIKDNQMEFIQGLAKSKGGILILLDVEKLLVTEGNNFCLEQLNELKTD